MRVACCLFFTFIFVVFVCWAVCLVSCVSFVVCWLFVVVCCLWFVVVSFVFGLCVVRCFFVCGVLFIVCCLLRVACCLWSVDCLSSRVRFVVVSCCQII